MPKKPLLHVLAYLLLYTTLLSLLKFFFQLSPSSPAYWLLPLGLGLALSLLFRMWDDQYLGGMGLWPFMPERPVLVLKSVAWGLSLAGFVFLIISLSLGIGWVPTTTSSLYSLFLLFFISLGLVLTEEFIFRGYAFQKLLQHLGPLPTLLLSCLGVGLFRIYMQDEWSSGGLILRTFLIGMGSAFFLAIIVLRYRTLYASIAAHTANVFISLAIFNLPGSAHSLLVAAKPILQHGNWALVFAHLFVTLFFILLLIRRRKLPHASKPSYYPSHRKARRPAPST